MGVYTIESLWPIVAFSALGADGPPADPNGLEAALDPKGFDFGASDWARLATEPKDVA